MKIDVIGMGNFGRSFADSMRKSAHEPYAYDRTGKKAEKACTESGAKQAKGLGELLANCEVAVLAVKPKDVGEALAQLAGSWKNQLLISVAAGISTKAIERHLGSGTRVIRAMPNIGFKVGKGATAYALGKWAGAEDERRMLEIFGEIGLCVRVEEAQLDAVTAVSGSGIAFLAQAIKAIADAGEKEGLDAKTSLLLAAQSAVGAGELILNGQTPEEIRTAVTSPNGTTASGWKVWDERKLDVELGAVIAAAVARCREIGQELKAGEGKR